MGRCLERRYIQSDNTRYLGYLLIAGNRFSAVDTGMDGTTAPQIWKRRGELISHIQGRATTLNVLGVLDFIQRSPPQVSFGDTILGMIDIHVIHVKQIPEFR